MGMVRRRREPGCSCPRAWYSRILRQQGVAMPAGALAARTRFRIAYDHDGWVKVVVQAKEG